MEDDESTMTKQIRVREESNLDSLADLQKEVQIKSSQDDPTKSFRFTPDYSFMQGTLTRDHRNYRDHFFRCQ